MIEEFESIIREATSEVEDILNLEDKGWIKLGSTTDTIRSDERKNIIEKSRAYAVRDPMAKQAIRLWTDYTFGTGMTWNTEDERAQGILSNFWDAKGNAGILSPRGQRKCSDKLLIDGEVFFAVFPGSQGKSSIRTIDPLEITEIITNPDDLEDVRYYKREWATPQGLSKSGYYRSFMNQKDQSAIDMYGKEVSASEDALVYHLPYNSTGQRGLPLLLPAIDWIYLYRKFLASRVAIMLALAKFAWKNKIKGGQAAVDAAKSIYNDQEVSAGSMAIENMGSDLQPIKTDTGAMNAYNDGRMIKLQVSAATGWPEQYFGDISIGNLATAKTVELPVQKMCQGYQAIWAGAFNDIDEVVLEHAGMSGVYIDRDFPPITPDSALEVAQSIAALVPNFPKLADSRDVLQSALMAIGVHDTNAALEQLDKMDTQEGSANLNLIKALKQFRETL